MPETYETLLLEKRERVAIITINRPDKRNALNIKTREEGAALLEELRKDSSVGVVVFTGAGDKAFIAGADIGEFAGRTSITQRDVMMGRSLFTAIDSFPKPVIAMVNGYCLGGGCELALACDVRIASETASFGQPEINIGVIPGAGGTQRLTRAVGKVIAMEMILNDRRLTAREAHKFGMVNRVVPVESYLDEALKLAEEIAARAPVAVRAAKKMINQAFERTLSEGLAAEKQEFYNLFATEDQKEGMQAFVEKRKPEWKGR